MKKNLFFLTLTFSIFSNAQYFEGFEKGVPGSMKQTYNKGETTWIDFGISAFDVIKPISDGNSAVFFNGMTTSEVTTSLETPILDLSTPNASLEFKYLQREKTFGYHNDLLVELSNDFGNTWVTLGYFSETSETIKKNHIDLGRFKPTKRSIIRFKSTQFKFDMGYPIVLDDIDIKNDSTSFEKNAKQNNISSVSNVKIYPNPSKGEFKISTNHSVNISISDLNGRVIYTMNEVSNDNQINLTSFQKGIYLIKINDKDSEQTQKIILE